MRRCGSCVDVVAAVGAVQSRDGEVLGLLWRCGLLLACYGVLCRVCEQMFVFSAQYFWRPFSLQCCVCM
jgi:hypothetical protein